MTYIHHNKINPAKISVYQPGILLCILHQKGCHTDRSTHDQYISEYSNQLLLLRSAEKVTVWIKNEIDQSNGHQQNTHTQQYDSFRISTPEVSKSQVTCQYVTKDDTDTVHQKNEEIL